MYNPFSLAGKTILVTGASSGIGRSTAIECSKLGAKVIITGRNQERLQETFNQLEGSGHQTVIADLSTIEMIDYLIVQIPEIDGCVCNAGIVTMSLTPYIKEQELNEILQINTIAPVMLTQRLTKQKKIKKGGSIVFTSSISGTSTVVLGNGIYSLSKAAINGFMKNAALDLGSKGIRCNSVCPGMIHTDLIYDGAVSDEQMKEDIKNYPLKRYGRPEEVAFAIIYLLSDASQWVTGTILIVDGGRSLP